MSEIRLGNYHNMRIGIYADIPEGKYGGIQQYIEKLTLALIENTTNTIVVITNEKLCNSFFNSLKTKNNFELFVTNRKQKVFTLLFYNRYTRIISEYLINGIPFIFYFTKYLGNVKPEIYNLKLDLIHLPIQNMQLYHWRIPSLISLHDLQHKYFPDFFSKQALYLRELHFKKSMADCDQIIVSFNHVKEDILKFYNIIPEKITVTSLGAENRFQNLETIGKKELLNHFNIPETYLFYPAQTWKHKNHLALLKALILIKEESGKEIHLVCSGRKSEYFNVLKDFISENNLDSQVSFPGFISNQELYSLYKYASLVVIPTLYEAGSFPLFEAMSVGCPVICSNVTSLPETIGDIQFTFDPNSSTELAAEIQEMLSNEKFRDLNIINSKNQIKKFTWPAVTKNFEEAYFTAIKNFKLNKLNP
jgi:glycosyltransferase involved in cell wall biosynthesis